MIGDGDKDRLHKSPQLEVEQTVFNIFSVFHSFVKTKMNPFQDKADLFSHL